MSDVVPFSLPTNYIVSVISTFVTRPCKLCRRRLYFLSFVAISNFSPAPARLSDEKCLPAAESFVDILGWRNLRVLQDIFLSIFDDFQYQLYVRMIFSDSRKVGTVFLNILLLFHSFRTDNRNIKQLSRQISSNLSSSNYKSISFSQLKKL